jgi:hypothetical protein
MALKLMDPINKMPFFQANQVLTYNHLNELAAYLYQQERYTRNKLIGSGIVCGLTFSWKPIALGNAEVLIDDGCAITSAGYLIVFKQPVNNAGTLVPYTHRRNFTRLKEFEPFKTVIGGANPTIYELITKDVFDSETDPTKAILTDSNKTDRVLILLYDIEALNIAKCLDESCDDKGKIYQYTPRPLLVPVQFIDLILNAPDTQPFFTEPGRGAKGKESQLFETDYLSLKNLFKGSNLQNVNTPADLINLFKNPCLDPELTIMSGKINALITKYPWVFNTQFNCMKTEVPALGGQTLGALFQTQAQTFRNNAANDIYMQYLYDFLRDVADAYNELYSSVTDMIGECGGNEFIHPFHVMLGLPTTNDTLACYQEEKYNEHNFKYRHYFVPSPVMDDQFMLYEKVQNQFKRLVRIIANFSTPTPNDVIIKVIPSKDYDWLLGDRAIPYFYLQAMIGKIRDVWNYDSTRRNKISRIKGYKLPFTQDQLLEDDTSKNDFYRIEGHIGSNVTSVEATIEALRNIYNLPFTVTSVSIQTTTNTFNCSFPDLEEEYSYYRDRVLGYLREIIRWLDNIEAAFQKVPVLKEFYDKFRDAILKLREILSARCIEHFNYNAYKKAYTLVWEAIFDLYQQLLVNNIAAANQALNTVQNILNIIFFRPIYKIWYMYQYRLAVIAQTQVTSLQSLASRTTGLEHLAGVRRGETFLLVSDTSKGNAVVADFNLPDLIGCSCDCKTKPCDEKDDKIPAVSPLEKPIIMVVDYSYTQQNAIIKTKAFLDPNNKFYILELDSMGFYKGNSVIDPEVKLVVYKTQNPFTDLIARWENEKLVLRYQINDNSEKDGFFKLNYYLTGNFDGNIVEGVIYLYVIGRIRGDKAANFDVAVGEEIKVTAYPYDKEAMKKVKPEMKFEGETKTRTIGGEKVKVYTTPNGNEVGIYKDKNGLSYMKVITAKTPGVEEVPFILEAGGASSRGSVNVNVIDKKDKLESDTVTGIIKAGDGSPLKDAKVRTNTGREVITNEKGEYTLTGLKAGEVITIEKQGFKTTNIQVNSRISTEVKLEKAPLINIKGLEDVKLPGNLGSLAEGINIGAFRNFMK